MANSKAADPSQLHVLKFYAYCKWTLPKRFQCGKTAAYLAVIKTHNSQDKRSHLSYVNGFGCSASE